MKNRKSIILLLFMMFNFFYSQDKFDYFDIPLELNGREHFQNVKCNLLYYTKDVDKTAVDEAIEIISKTNKFEKDYGKKNYFSISKSEQKYLILELQKIKEFIWNDNLFPNSKAVFLKDIDHVFKTTTNLSTEEQKLMCSIIYSFSQPIYFRNNKYALIFYQETYLDHQSISISIYKVDAIRIPTEEFAIVYSLNRQTEK